MPVVVIAPLVVLMLKPPCGGAIAKLFVPVPPVTESAELVNTRPCVVVIFERPLTVMVSLTVKVKFTVRAVPRASVTVTVSL